MNSFKFVYRCVLVGLAIASIATTVEAKYYPNTGQLCGRVTSSNLTTMTSTMLWEVNGPWIKNIPGYEHDIKIERGFYQSCTSTTTLPSGYDDCRTAGVSEPNANILAYGFGSYYSKSITTNVVYRGTWLFTGPTTPQMTRFTLTGQEVSHEICPFDLPECMDSVLGRTKELIRFQPLNRAGAPQCINWDKL